MHAFELPPNICKLGWKIRGAIMQHKATALTLRLTGLGSSLRALSAGVCMLALLATPGLAGTLSYSYDDLGRVKRVTYPNGTVVDYSYDSADNRTQVVRTPPAPSAGNVSLTTAYNTAGTVALAPAGSWTSLSVVTTPANGTASISGSNATFTPNAGYIGSTSFTYKASGAGGDSAPATVSVTVTAPAIPTAGNVSMTTAYNAAGSVTLAPGGVWTSLSVVSQSPNGTAAISGTTATFTPNAGFIGTTSFTYKATGPGGQSSSATVNVTVNAPAAPTAANVSSSTNYNTAASIALAPGGMYNSLAIASQPANGTVSVSGTTATFTPNTGFIGNTSFTYTASGPGGTSAPGTVTVSVAAPAAPTVGNVSLSTGYNTSGTVALSPSGTYSSLAIASQPANGSASVSGTTATFTPNAGFYGNTSFTYTATGAGGTSSPATVSVNVATPPAPAVSNVTLNTAYNTAGSVALAPSGVYNSLSVASQPANGSASISGTAATFTPNTGFYGNTSFTYTATGPGGTSSPATVSVNVAIPAAPTAGNVSLTTSYNTAGSVALAPSGVYTSLAVASQPANGTASISGTTATFTPNSGFSGNTSFTYTVSGPGGTSAPATVSVNVPAYVNQPPICNNWQQSSSYPAPPYGPNSITLNIPAAAYLYQCHDPDGGTLSLVTPTMPYPITVVRGQTRYVSFTVSDGQGGSSTATLTVIFQP
ncbi:Ig-like domain-containing protein [Asticcacaulis sp. MM231]|uniref:Ig-like domain-containing protein n=1 Tax=Asticcacaulis sp. MM231 TaxID=3157666 RepID=UPI0032D59B2A